MKTNSGNTVVIISGTSQGIGKAMLKSLTAKDIPTLSINRQHLDLRHPAAIGNLIFDLGQLDSIDALTDEILKSIHPMDAGRIILINNAAIVGNPGPLDELAAKSIKKTLDINLLSPLLLSKTLIHKIFSQSAHSTKTTKQKHIDVINISSGAAFDSIPGMGPYCISKAGLEMVSKVLNTENENVRSITIGPGVVDTGMQDQLRATDPAQFQSHSKFISFKEKGHLQTPHSVGLRIISFLLKGDFLGGKHYGIAEI